MQALRRPPLSCGLSRDFCLGLGGELVPPRGSALPTERLGGIVLARIADVLLDLAGQNLWQTRIALATVSAGRNGRTRWCGKPSITSG